MNIPDPDIYETFTFKLHIDDGALVYINGVEVIRDRFNPGTAVSFSTLADQAGNEGTFDDFVVPSEAFAAGANVIAVEVHQNTAGSSDMVLDMALDATERTIPLGSDLLFEWDADWESGELAVLDTQLEVPATATREGRLYRARVRYKDDTGRWSNWSEPVQFTTTLPDIQPLLDNLVISEIMYHPAAPTAAEADAGFTDQDDFEYVEIHNVSDTETLTLTDVRFTKGIDFDFAPGSTIGPGEYRLVVRNQAAFEFRYGAALPVVGEYMNNDEGALSNGGERLKLSFGGGVPIRDFDYDDRAPWPEAADGTGVSLVLVGPASVPDHALPASWTTSTASNGSPGMAEPAGITLAEWLAQFGIADADPSLDDDGDGLSRLIEFGLAGDPTKSLASERPRGGVAEVDGQEYFTITFQRQASATGVTYTVEFSPDLATWASGGVLVESNPGPDNSVVETWRAPLPIEAGGSTFGRVRVSQ